MSKWKEYIKLFDIVIVLAVLALSCLSLMLFPHSVGDYVTITEHGVVIYEGSLAKDAEITTRSGKNTIRIEDGVAYMLHADCNDKTCVNMGAASTNRPVVCLPNEVMIIITSSKNALDDITY